MAIARPHRITNTGFAEINVPIVGKDNELPFVHALTFNVSGRIDSYSDFGNTENYKLGFTYEPFAALTIRATNGTSYRRAQPCRYLGAGYAFHLYRPAHRREHQRAAGHIGGRRAAPLHQHTGRQSAAGAGNRQNLVDRRRFPSHHRAGHRPDRVSIFSITAFHTKFEHQQGLILNNPGLLFSGAYNQYYILNPTLAQIQARYPTNFNANGSALVATTGFPGPDLASAFNTPGVNQPYILYDLRRNNLGEALIEGLDFAMNYTTDIEGFGTLSGGFSGTFNTTNTNTPAPGLAPINLVQYSVPLSAVTAFVAATVGPVTGRVTVNYSPGFNVSPVLNQALSLYGQTAHRIIPPGQCLCQL